MNAPTEPVPGHSPRQVILGLFILAQMAFLVAQNFLGFFEECQGRLPAEIKQTVGRIIPDWPEKQGHAWDHAELLSKRLRFWSQLTGQEQAWSLFAPGVAKRTGFPAVLLTWDDDPSPATVAHLLAANDPWQAAALLHALPLEENDFLPADALRMATRVGTLAANSPFEAIALWACLNTKPVSDRPSPIVLLSDNEPRDREHFFRFGHFRLRRIESQLVLNLMPGDDQTPEDWSKSIKDHVREYGGLMHGYLRWRLADWQAKNANVPPPRQVVFLDRAFRIHSPEEDGPRWDGPFVQPLARWLPHAKWDDEHGALERFDPIRQRFEPTSK
jgi:hypothetical protein